MLFDIFKHFNLLLIKNREAWLRMSCDTNTTYNCSNNFICLSKIIKLISERREFWFTDSQIFILELMHKLMSCREVCTMSVIIKIIVRPKVLVNHGIFELFTYMTRHRFSHNQSSIIYLSSLQSEQRVISYLFLIAHSQLITVESRLNDSAVSQLGLKYNA